MSKSFFLAIIVAAVTSLAAEAAPQAPLSIAQIYGWYGGKSKYTEYYIGLNQNRPLKGSYVSSFIIEPGESADEVLITWVTDTGDTWYYIGYYRNGLLVATAGDDLQQPPRWEEVLVLKISGSSGKYKIKGKYIHYDITEYYLDSEILSLRKTN